MKRFLLLILLIVLSSCASETICKNSQDESCIRVLFIGNSYTFVNDLPNTFANLAKSGGYRTEVGMAAHGGWRLSDHIQSSETLDLLNSARWDFVVLQEQSQIPSVEQFRTQTMYPAARELVDKIRGIEATPIFFLTWARRDGWSEQGMDNFEGMQNQINSGYLLIAQELNAPIAPVGSAWLTAVKQHPELNLWQEDGSHPSEQGTYLAACVFYAVIFRESPARLAYHANLSREAAETLQIIAAKTVLKMP